MTMRSLLLLSRLLLAHNDVSVAYVHTHAATAHFRQRPCKGRINVPLQSQLRRYSNTILQSTPSDNAVSIQTTTPTPTEEPSFYSNQEQNHPLPLTTNIFGLRRRIYEIVDTDPNFANMSSSEEDETCPVDDDSDT
eukprot:4351631-Ditylum_brightwellii.AAC.1